jgi:hypothetical protein
MSLRKQTIHRICGKNAPILSAATNMFPDRSRKRGVLFKNRDGERLLSVLLCSRPQLAQPLQLRYFQNRKRTKPIYVASFFASKPPPLTKIRKEGVMHYEMLYPIRPGKNLFKRLLAKNEIINKIIDQVRCVLDKDNKTRDTFLKQSWEQIRSDKNFQEEIFIAWTNDKIRTHIESEKELLAIKWDKYDVLLFHLLGMAYGIPNNSYPSEELCISYLDDELTPPPVPERLQINAIVLLDGVFALGEMQTIAREYSAAFTARFQHFTTQYQYFPTVQSIIEAKKELLKLCEQSFERGDWIQKLQRCLSRLPETTNISLPNDFFSSDQDLCLASVHKEGEASKTALLDFLRNDTGAEYTTDTIRELLSNLTPPLRSRDRYTVLSELDDVDKGEGLLESTCIVRVILPVIKGEKKLSTDDEDYLGEEFSRNFVYELKEGRISLHSSVNAGDTTGYPPSAARESDATLEEPIVKIKEAALPKLESDLPEDDKSPDSVPIFTENKENSSEDCNTRIDEEQIGIFIDEGTTRIRRIMTTLLENRRDCELYWLMKEAPQPEVPVWLAELLYLGTRLQPGFTSSQNHIKTLIEEGENYYYTHEGTFPETMCMLLAASLIRPVLMMPDPSYKPLLDKLIEPLARYRCEPLLQRLGEFAVKGKALDDAMFKELSRISQGQKYREELVRRTHAILATTSGKKTIIQRATAVVKELFSSRGELGIVLHACLDGDYSHISPCLEKPWDDRNFLSKSINNLDERRNKLHKGTEKIDHKAFNAIARDVATAKQLLTEWDRWQKQDVNQKPNEFSYRELNTIAEQAHPESLPNTPFVYFLQAQLEELRSKFDTSIARNPAVDPLEELAVWPIILEQAEFSSEGFFHIPLEDLLQYLEKDMSDRQTLLLSNSLLSHIRRGHFSAVDHYLNIFPQYKTDTLIVEREEQFERWGAIFDEREDMVQREVVDAYLRGVIQENLESDLIRKIADIASSQRQGKLDAHQAINSLDKIRSLLDEQENHHKKELRARLDDVGKSIPEETIQSINLLIESNQCAQAYDAIARVNDFIAGRPNSALPATPSNSASSDVEDFFELLRNNAIPSLSPQKETNEITAWDNLSKSGRFNRDDKQIGRVTELLRWLGFSLERDVMPTKIYDAGAPAFWNVDQYTMTIDSPIPQWGSLAKRHTIIMGWPPQHDYLSQLLNTLFTTKSDKLDRTQPITVLWFGSISYEQRMRLIQQCGGGVNTKYLPVVIDSNLFRWLHLHETGERRTEALFNVALAGSPRNPYTPNAAGAVPREMFFGREKDIEALWDPYGPCVVYGGRQLGKSALLLQVKSRYQNVNAGQHVLFLSVGQTYSSLIDAALQEMKRENILPERTTRNTFLNNVKTFLDQDLNSRILFLFDECDAILEQDAKAEKPFRELTVLRDLMMQTERRFKIVLTGLHSVQRFSSIPNSPLPHFGGEPLCVGPLQPRDASDLVREPMGCLGLKFESFTLVNTILIHTNYHPSLIQLFCEELVTSISQRTNATLKLPIIIDKDIISQVYKKADLRTKIRQRFDWTLALDQRYRAIGYTLALWELTEALNQQGSGMRVSALLQELRNTWPAAFKDMEQIEVESLLKELVGLGILSPVGSAFRLRTPNIIHLLGGEENILNELEQFQSLPYTPQAERLKDMRTKLFNNQPDPLVFAQYNTIKSRQAGLILVVGTEAHGLYRVPETLKNIERTEEGQGRKGVLVNQISGANTPEISRAIVDQNKALREGGLILWMDGREIPDLEEALLAIQKWQRSLHTDKKFVKIVCLIDAREFIALQAQPNAETLISSTATQILFLRRWTLAGLDEWYRSSPPPPDPLEHILQITGGWDVRVMAYLEGKTLPDLKRNGYALPHTPEAEELVGHLNDFDGILAEEDLRELMPNAIHFDILLETLTSLGILTRSHDDLLSLEPCLAASLKGAI